MDSVGADEGGGMLLKWTQMQETRLYRDKDPASMASWSVQAGIVRGSKVRHPARGGLGMGGALP